MTPDQLDPKNEALFALAIQLAGADRARDSDEYWRVIRQLHRSVDRKVFETAAACCTAVNSAERIVGLHVIAQIGLADEHGVRPFTHETVPILRARLTDQDDAVVEAALHAVGHHRQAKADDLRELAHHASPDIREAVAFALTGCDEDDAIALLIQLTRDTDDDVRDWATFAIGSQTDADGPHIRQALFDRLSDAVEVVRGEALVGLARLRDEKAIDFIVEALRSPHVLELVFEAGEELLAVYPDNSRLKAALANWRPD